MAGQGIRRFLSAATLALCCFFAAPALAQAPEGSPVAVHGQLSVRGNQIVDQNGAPVTLRGMSLFWSQWMPQYYNADAVRWLRDDWNVSVVRAAIAVPAGGYLQNPERETAKAEAVIDAAIALGIYVIVDWHAHDPAPEAAARFFDHIAERYGNTPNVIYETWNEPLPRYNWATDIKPYHEALIPHIRAHDPDNIIIAGTGSWSQDVEIAAADPLAFSNVGYALHFYAGTHRQSLRDKAQRALDLGAALMVTEWGTAESNGDGPLDQAEIQRWWDFMEANHISYANWSIADKSESTAALRPGAEGNGGWPDDMISPSGLLVRAHIRGLNGAYAGH
ncbi:MAG: glycoside hydrolase family 5 protein [Terricaulis sp.]